jgi:lambda family phage minor tail protein L
VGIYQAIQGLGPKAVVEFLTVEGTTRIPGLPTYRFCGTVNEFGGDVVWQGNTYIRWSYDAQGWDKTGTGTIPRPSITLANPEGIISGLCMAYDDLAGAVVTRKRTLVQYLDAANFVDGNAHASNTSHFPDEQFIIDRKSGEDFSTVSFELTSPWDLPGVMLPGRIALARTCLFEYRGTDGCGYTGNAYFDVNDNPSDANHDKCSQRLKGCRLRFGPNVRFGGFPGLGRTAIG